MTTIDKYHELSFYTLGLHDKEFIHQHIVDAFTAQTADEKTKNITLYFSLAGLYLFLKKEFIGRQVQFAHQHMAKKTKEFIDIDLPVERGVITIANVLNCPEGAKRNDMITQWCESVWNAYSSQHNKITKLTETLLIDISFKI